MKLYYLDENYEPQGMLKGVSVYIADLMVREQVEQGNPPCVNVFERSYDADYGGGGFDWDDASFSNGGGTSFSYRLCKCSCGWRFTRCNSN